MTDVQADTASSHGGDWLRIARRVFHWGPLLACVALGVSGYRVWIARSAPFIAMSYQGAQTELTTDPNNMCGPAATVGPGADGGARSLLVFQMREIVGKIREIVADTDFHMVVEMAVDAD